METKNKRNYFKESGITLIALVVTIVVLLILAGVSINAIFNDNGIIQKAQDAQSKMNAAKENDEKVINDLNNWIDSQVNGTNGGRTQETTAKVKLDAPVLTYLSSYYQINLSKVSNVDHYDFYNGSTKLCTIDKNGDAVGTPVLTTMDANGEYFIISLADSSGTTRLNAAAIPNEASIKVRAVPESNSEQYVESDFSNVIEFSF